MYIKTKCSACGQENFHNLHLRVLEVIRGGESSFSVDDVLVTDTVAAEQLARDVLLELEGYVYDGISTDELCKMLKRYFGVAAKHCCDIIQRLKINLDMYCPDRKHLYYVGV
ncbi:MAG: hypothetical protein ACXQTE_01400 [Methanosarcinaceae archaeon]